MFKSNKSDGNAGILVAKPNPNLGPSCLTAFPKPWGKPKTISCANPSGAGAASPSSSTVPAIAASGLCAKDEKVLINQKRFSYFCLIIR